MSTPPFQFQPNLSYQCTNCGKCCGEHWKLHLDTKTLERMKKEWTVQTPKMNSPQDFYLPVGNETNPEYVFKCVDGKCVFLDEENLCVMHREWSFTEKASNCMQYPFTFTEAPDGIRVGLLFSCEGVALADPKEIPLPLEEANDIFPVARQVFKIGETVSLTPEKEISFAQYKELEEFYFQLLETESPLEDALIAYGLFLDDYVIHTNLPQISEQEKYLAAAQKLKGRLSSQRSFLITLITLLDSMMHGSQSLGFFRLMKNQVKASLNRGKVPIEALGEVSLKGLEDIPFPPENSERLRTFLIQVVWRRRLLPRVSVHRGFRIICIYYGLTRFIARSIAQIQQEATISQEILLQALEILERYYISHSKFTQAFDDHSTMNTLLNPIFYNSVFVPILVRSC